MPQRPDRKLRAHPNDAFTQPGALEHQRRCRKDLGRGGFGLGLEAPRACLELSRRNRRIGLRLAIRKQQLERFNAPNRLSVLLGAKALGALMYALVLGELRTCRLCMPQLALESMDLGCPLVELRLVRHQPESLHVESQRRSGRVGLRIAGDAGSPRAQRDAPDRRDSIPSVIEAVASQVGR